MFKQILVAALGLLGVASSKVTGVPYTRERSLTKTDAAPVMWTCGYAPVFNPTRNRINGTHGSSRRRRFRSLKAKARRA